VCVCLHLVQACLLQQQVVLAGLQKLIFLRVTLLSLRVCVCVCVCVVVCVHVCVCGMLHVCVWHAACVCVACCMLHVCVCVALPVHARGRSRVSLPTRQLPQ
jgi:cbb3-type cytochrome oxidase subunit 1